MLRVWYVSSDVPALAAILKLKRAMVMMLLMRQFHVAVDVAGSYLKPPVMTIRGCF